MNKINIDIEFKKGNLELRMYSLVMYNISGIQAGIQSGHSDIEYMLAFNEDPRFWEWAKYWKTVIRLNGGTSNSGKDLVYNFTRQKGSMEKHLESLINNGIKCAPFYEPDLNNALSSISLLVDERVFNNKDYPDWISDYLNDFGRPLDNLNLDNKEVIQKLPHEEKRYNMWLERIGGKKIAFLKNYFNPKKIKLASN